jgi:heat shock protein HslJ
MYCEPEELMNEESEYLYALENSSSYQIIGSQLLIANAEGKTFLAYEMYEPAALNETN